ncbi:hypothetical protein WMY93_018730 [Mugilogobius chulae]|uniref:Uncharacterized protein n=1 Tax=Mugilogobius chulae TaxID=88201 RepID=A0AAW0NRM8_9GOBI
MAAKMPWKTLIALVKRQVVVEDSQSILDWVNCCKFEEGEKEYPAAYGKTKKEAKEEAAKLVTQESKQTNVSKLDTSLTKDTDYVSEINLYCHEAGCGFNYIEVSPEAESQHRFACRMEIAKQLYPVGTGRNKKEAKQMAAQLAWSALQEQLDLDSETNGARSNVPPSPVQQTGITQPKYMSWLNEYGHKNNLSFKAVESSEQETTNTLFCCKFEVGEKEYPAAYGKTKKEAKEEAAKLVYHEICDPQTAGEDVNHATGGTTGGTGAVAELSKKASEQNVSKLDTSLTKDTDYVSEINLYCHEAGCGFNYIEVSPEAESQHRFACRIEIDKQLYPVGTGMNKKEAKLMAAQLAWSALQEQLDLDRKTSVGSAVSQDDESETTSATASNLLEPRFSKESTQSGSESIQFLDSKSSPVKASSQDINTEKDTENNQTKTNSSRFISEYCVLDVLGSGGYGYVYKAKNSLGKDCAIKEIKTKDKEKSLDEVKVLWELHHLNIVRFYTYWFEDTGYRCTIPKPNVKFLFIEMELCDGGTLRSWICKKNKEPAESSRHTDSLDFARQILSGVEYIHHKKLIHRDLKPGNILIGQDGRAKIGDFGLATQDNEEGEVVERTEGKGTHSYMAPEQFGVNYDRKVDIFALGLIFLNSSGNIYCP